MFARLSRPPFAAAAAVRRTRHHNPHNPFVSRRYATPAASTAASVSRQRQQRIRNIGILAHIDAGKTTTTERMLFYAGKTHHLGEVHDGTTVTDCLAQERERGITICSAAVSFDWIPDDDNADGRQHRINVLDTPGHIDFTMEVEQSLGACDGGVVILDGSAGVEVQTLTVWRQADRQRLPRLVFVNKMDRRDADFEAAIDDMRRKLAVRPVALQSPVYATATATAVAAATRGGNGGGAGGLAAIVDLVRLELLEFNANDDGRTYSRRPLDGDRLHDAQQQRDQLVDAVSAFDDQLADAIIAGGSLRDIGAAQLMSAVRRATIARHVVPVLLGSAYKNAGVQPLLDAVCSLLPSPRERNRVYDCFAGSGDVAGKVVKVTHDRQRGALCLVRMMRGRLRRGAKLVNSNGAVEHVQRLYEPLADEYREVQHVDEGDVAVVGGLRSTSTGDLLLASMSSLRAAQKRLRKTSATDLAVDDANEPATDAANCAAVVDLDASVALALGLRPRIPDAVYFCSVEPPSQSQQLALETALRQLQREDPSLRVTYDDSTMQTVLGGMGELHLDVVRSRLLTEYKIDAELGPLQIAYRETLAAAADDEEELRQRRQSLTVEKDIAGAKQSVMVEMSLLSGSDEAFKLDTTPEATQRLSLVWSRHLGTVRKGALGALERGPKVGGQLVDVQVVLHDLRVGRGTADSFVAAAAAQCVQRCLLAADCRLQEPIMAIQIVVGADRTAAILADLAKRRATVLDVSAARGDGSSKVIDVLAPLAELAGYSSRLRIISSGAASMSMQPHGYAMLTAAEEGSAMRRAQGLE